VQIQHTCNERRFALLAYVFMPDHLHMLLQGLAPDSNFVATMTLIRQRTSIAFHERQRIILWQRGYFERVLRDEETTEKVACYLLANPVRAGLVTRAEEYPHMYCWRNIDCARAQ
jgi:REP element-mobilizing transposase RayT